MKVTKSADANVNAFTEFSHCHVIDSPARTECDQCQTGQCNAVKAGTSHRLHVLTEEAISHSQTKSSHSSLIILFHLII